MENIIIESNRGKKQLVLKNFKFCIISCNKELKYTVIRCQFTTKNCVAKVYTKYKWK